MYGAFVVIWTLLYGAVLVYGMAQIDGSYYTLENLARDAIIAGLVWVVGLGIAYGLHAASANERTASAPAQTMPTPRSQPVAAHTEKTKRCPDCAEEVKAEARICRYCRHEFPAATPAALPPPVGPTDLGRWKVAVPHSSGFDRGLTVSVRLDEQALVIESSTLERRVDRSRVDASRNYAGMLVVSHDSDVWLRLTPLSEQDVAETATLISAARV